MITRRDLLKSSVVAGLSTAAPSLFAASAQRAFSSSFSNPQELLGPTKLTFDRPLPAGLSGTLYRNGPARMQRGNTQYDHWFDGDGMVQSFKIDKNELVHQGRMVRTTRYEEEEKAGRFLRPGFGTTFDDAQAVTKPDDINVSNISVLPVEDEIWSLWEAGSAWELNPNTLETISRKVLSPETDGLPFSAHPRVEANGRIWNFGYFSGSNKLVIYDIASSGQLQRVEVINANNSAMVHDFAMTDRYLIFVLMPFTFEFSGGSTVPAFSDLLGWDEQGGVEVLVIDKNTLSVAHKFELPGFLAFHFGNAWQDGHQLRIEVAMSNSWEDIDRSIRLATQGASQHSVASGQSAGDIVLDLKSGNARVENLPIIDGDFPGFDSRFAGKRTRYLSMVNRSGSTPDDVFGFNQLVQFDRSSGQTQTWDYGSDYIAEEHVFVPQANKPEGTGWLIGTAYNWVTEQSSFRVFDALRVANGPIAQAQLPYRLPLGLHGKFVAT